jgi:RHS repeat-associated protein
VDALGRPDREQGPLPTLPAGVRKDASCVSPLVTGDAARFTGADVVTLSRSERELDPQQRLLLTTHRLQRWTMAGQSPVWRRHRVYYDGLARQYLKADQSAAPDGDAVTCANYDADGRALRNSVPVFETASFTCTSTTGNAALWSTNTYDVYGRITEQTQPFGADASGTTVTRLSYETGLKQTITRAAGTAEAFVKKLEYDYFDSERELVTMIVPGDSDATTVYTYDRIGRLTSIRDPITASNPGGVTNAITYDSLNRRISVDNPDQNTTGDPARKALALTYSAQTGLLARSTDAAAQTTEFSYDQLGRMTRKKLPDGDEILYSYDDTGVPNGLGQRTGVRATGSAEYAYTYGYDPYGLLQSQTLALAGASYTTARVYDPRRQLTDVVWPDGKVDTTSYDMGNLASLSSGLTVFARFQGYTPLGQPARVGYGNGATTAFTYAPTGQPVTQTVADAAGQTLLDNQLAFDHLLEVTAVNDRLKPGGRDHSMSFGYTSMRLTRATAPGLYGTLDYGYDASGNLTRRDAVTHAYEAHRITSSGAGGEQVTFRYDDSGNMVSRTSATESRSYTYDPRDRLLAVHRDQGGVREEVLSIPIYNDDGDRLQKVSDKDGIVTLYIDAGYQITRQGQKRATTRLIGADGFTVATVTEGDEITAPGVPVPGTLYFHRDHLGSTSVTTDEDGGFASRMVYLPYGQPYDAGLQGPDDFRSKFQGKELDVPANLYYFGARYYDPALGRFLTPDTSLGDTYYQTDALNRFAFAANNPVTFTDPTGHSVWDAIIGGVIGALEIVAGVALDVLSDGALEPIGGALIGAGTNGITYSATHAGNFSWKQYGAQQGQGAAIGLVTGGFGGEAEGGVSMAAEVAEDASASAAEMEAASAVSDAEGAALQTAADSGAGAEADGAATAGSESLESGGCGNSFAAGTPVWTPGGLVAIETIAPGDLVLARDENSGAVGWMPVTRTFNGTGDHVVEIELVTGRGVRETLRATAHHPFFVSGRGWIEAGRVQAGQRIEQAQGGRSEVRGVRTVDRLPDVYNLEVARYHSYFVGESGVWVHNQWFGSLCRTVSRSIQGVSTSSRLATRYRVVGEGWDEQSVTSGLLTSKAQQAGFEANNWNTGLLARVWHSFTSDIPPSQFVSVTSDVTVARNFALQAADKSLQETGVFKVPNVYQFEVRESDMYRAWWNNSEAEDLPPGGTRIYNPRLFNPFEKN